MSGRWFSEACKNTRNGIRTHLRGATKAQVLTPKAETEDPITPSRLTMDSQDPLHRAVGLDISLLTTSPASHVRTMRLGPCPLTLFTKDPETDTGRGVSFQHPKPSKTRVPRRDTMALLLQQGSSWALQVSSCPCPQGEGKPHCGLFPTSRTFLMSLTSLIL